MRPQEDAEEALQALRTLAYRQGLQRGMQYHDAEDAASETVLTRLSTTREHECRAKEGAVEPERRATVNVMWRRARDRTHDYQRSLQLQAAHFVSWEDARWEAHRIERQLSESVPLPYQE